MSLPLKFRNTAKSNQSLPSLRHDKLLLRMSRKVQRLTRIAMCVCAEQIASLQFCEGYHECVHPLAFQAYASRRSNALHMAPYDDYVNDPNKWASSDIVTTDNWEDTLRQREVQSSWSTSTDISISPVNSSTANQLNENEIAQTDAIEGWIHALQSVSAGEVEYMANENDRADAARKMQEWGFTAEQIENALGVATTLNLEKDNGILDKFREATAKSGFGMYVDDIDLDLKAVESHAMVDREESGEVGRTQMVYVDEHSCIGCTNCAMIAPSTFFMEDYLGRARVFAQWGDDDETIKTAIETCPVDCIHYVPYDELVRLEIERRNQNINFKTRLVGSGETGSYQGPKFGGGLRFTEPQRISGNMAARCSNCPTAGCKNCPMYGIGKNPEFEKNEKLRMERKDVKLRRQTMDNFNKSADL